MTLSSLLRSVAGLFYFNNLLSRSFIFIYELLQTLIEPANTIAYWVNNWGFKITISLSASNTLNVVMGKGFWMRGIINHPRIILRKAYRCSSALRSLWVGGVEEESHSLQYLLCARSCAGLATLSDFFFATPSMEALKNTPTKSKKLRKWSIIFNPYINLARKVPLFHFRDEKEKLRGEVTCLRSKSKWVAEVAFHPRCAQFLSLYTFH